MIVFHLQGGLGNQLFQIFTVIATALATGQPFGFFKTLQNGITERPTYFTSFLHVLNNYIVPRGKQKKIHYTFEEAGFQYKPLIAPLSKFFQVRKGTLLLNGYFQSYKYFDEFYHSIVRLLQLTTSVDVVRHKFLTNMPFLPDFDTAVSLHFRLGDYVKLQEYFVLLPLSYYMDAIGVIVERDPKVRTVLYFCEQQDKERVEAMIFTLSRAYPTLSFTPCLDGLQDWEEMCAMSCCAHNVIANSTFSWWGAYLNSNANKVVCYPEAWFGPAYRDKSTVDLFPPSWVKVAKKM